MALRTVDETDAAAADDPGPRSGSRTRTAGSVRPVWWGIAGLAILTAIFAFTFQTQLFVFNTFLLAIIGAVALSMLVGTTGLLSLGNASFMSIGAFATVAAMNAGVPLGFNIAIGGFVAGLAGLLIGMPVARLRGFHMALATLAGFFIIDYITYQFQTKNSKGGAAGFNFPTLYNSRGLDGGQQAWSLTLLVIVAMVLLVATRLVKERSGRALRMIRDHELAAGTLGISSTRYKLVVFAFTSALIGVQGGLLAYLLGSANTTTFTLHVAINYLAMVLIGGADSVLGAVIGAGVLTAIPVVVPDLISSLMGGEDITTGTAISVIVSGLLLVFFIAAAPRGLVGLWAERGSTLLTWRRTAGANR